MDPFDLRHWNGFAAAGGKTDTPALIHSVAYDSRAIVSDKALFVALRGANVDGHAFLSQAARAGAQFALVQQGTQVQGLIPLYVADPLTAFQEIAHCYRKRQSAQIMAITGSYGKTLTKDLLVHLLKMHYRVYGSPESFNSQLGVALSLFGITQEHDLAVIEVGVSKPGEMARLAWMVEPDYALLTCVEEAHLESMGSLEVLLEEKLTLLRKIPQEGWAVVPPNCAPKAIKAPLLHWEESTHVPPEELPFLERVMKRASCAAKTLGLTEEQIKESLTSYTPEPMRTECWLSSLGALVINDCYCADPHSIETAQRLIDYHCQGQKRFVLMDTTLHERSGQSPPLRFDTHQQAFDALRTTNLTDSCILIKGPRRQPLDKLSEWFSEGLGDNRLYIHFDAIRHNIHSVQRHLGPHRKIMAMLKARAYGTDPLALARFLPLCGVSHFGLAHVFEAVSLRLSGIEEELFVLNCAPYEAPQVVRWNLQVGVSNETLVEALEELRQPSRVHLHVNTGMGRLGIHPKDALHLARRIARSPFVKLEGIMTHFAAAESAEQDAFTMQQLETLHAVIRTLKDDGIDPPLKHIANSSGALRGFLGDTNMVRIGLGLYGIHASAQTTLHLRPALTLTSRLASIQTHNLGETIGYGRTYRVERPIEKIGVLPLGYFDGIHRHHSNRSHVILREKRAPICGTVCMDYLTINITDIPEAQLHDNVRLFGPGQSAEEFAGSESVYQLITCLGPRIQRIFIYDNEARDYILRKPG